MTAEALCAQLVSTLGDIERMLLVEPESAAMAMDMSPSDSSRDRFEAHFVNSLFDGTHTEH